MGKRIDAGNETQTARNEIGFVLVVFVGLLVCGAALGDVYDHFDDGVLDPAWEVTFEDTEGWTYTESGTHLTATDIEDIGSIVYVSQDFYAPGEFEVECSFSWDSGGSDTAMQSFGVELLSGETRVALAYYRDPWYFHRGAKQGYIGSDLYSSGLNTLPLSGSAVLRIARVSGMVTVYWDDSILLSAGNTEAVDKLRIWFVRSDYATGTFGSFSVDYVDANSEDWPFAFRPEPGDGEAYVDPDAVLRWVPGEEAVSHDVYLGRDFNDVNDADTTSAEFMGNIDVNSFDPCGLDLGTDYYWRIDEVDGVNTVKGDVWSFTTWRDLIAWWKLDEGAGLTAYDSAGNNDGTLINGPVWTLSGIDGALDFDGVDDHVDLGNDNSLKPPLPVTISGWIKLSAINVNQMMIVGIDDRTDYYYGIWFYVTDYDKLAIGYGDGGVKDSGHRRSKVGTTELSPNIWYHVSAVIKGPVDIDIYIDGLDDGGIYSGSGGGLVYSNGNSLIADGDQSYDLHFNGSMDDVRIYDRALSPNDVAELYSSASPVNYYDVDGVYGDDLNDGLTPETAFETIQMGIDSASDGDMVLVFADVYVEELDFDGKAITVASFDEPAVLMAPSFYAVTFIHGEGPDSVFKNFIVKDSYAGFLCLFSSPTISNVTVVDCNNGVIADEGSNPVITNSIFWNNTDTDLSDCVATYSFVEDEITDGLAAYWKFDEGSGGTAYDSVGSNDGTINGATWTTGVIDGALEFDGNGNYVNVGDADNLEGFSQVSIAAWIYWNGSDHTNFIAGKEYRYKMDIKNSQIRFLTGNSWSGSILTSSQVMNTNTWYHLVATYNGSQKRIYIDGIQDDNIVNTSGGIGSSSRRVTVGAYFEIYNSINDWINHFDGSIDDVRIYDRALSGGEVRQVYSSVSGPLFVDAAGGDYHLKSEGWRWASGVGWTWDDVTSPCIDYGNSGTPLRNEPMTIDRDPDNFYGENVRANMGAYGGTSEASMGPVGWAWLADLNSDRVVDWIDVGLWAGYWLESGYELPGDLSWDGIVNGIDYALLALDFAGEMGEPEPGPDTTAPVPNPMLWSVVLDANGMDGRPYEYSPTGGTWDYWVIMRADPNTTDSSGSWEFYFECLDESGFDSG